MEKRKEEDSAGGENNGEEPQKRVDRGDFTATLVEML